MIAIPIFAKMILSLFPDGITNELLIDLLEERGYDRDDSLSIIKKGLDNGNFKLSNNLKVMKN